MEPALLTNITVQDNLDGVLSTPPGTEHIPPVCPAPVSTPTQLGVNAVNVQVAASQQPEKIIPVWVYFSVASAVVMSVVYWFRHVA